MGEHENRRMLQHRLARPLLRDDPEYSVARRMKIAVPTLLFYLAGYFAISELWAATRPSGIDPTIGLDRRIEQVPEAVWGYTLLYGLIAASVLGVMRWENYRRMMLGIVGVCAISFTVYLLWPSHMVLRPAPNALAQTPSEWVLFWFYTMDRANNIFPSLHMGVGTVVTLVARREYPRAGWLWIVGMVIVTVSIPYTRQHYVLDLVAGTAVGAGVFAALYYTPLVEGLDRAWRRMIAAGEEG